MAAVRALADLVHCPVASSSLQPTPFPLAEALQADGITQNAQQTAVLQSLNKERLPSLAPLLPVHQQLPGLHFVLDMIGLCLASCIVCQRAEQVTVQLLKGPSPPDRSIHGTMVQIMSQHCAMLSRWSACRCVSKWRTGWQAPGVACQASAAACCTAQTC